MSPLVTVLIFLLWIEDVSAGHGTIYRRPGGVAVLPCEAAPTVKCSVINWLYSRDPSQTEFVAENGSVRRNSARAARLSLTGNCTLIISNITAEDAGFYTCRPGKTIDQNTLVFLNILTISPSKPDTDPKKDGNVTLECSLLRYRGLPFCQPNSIRWVDETGALLGGQKNCVSTLTVKRQSGNNRRYTCQYVEGNSVKIEAHYTLVFTDSTHSNSPLTYIMLALRVTTLILMTGITVLVIREKGSKKSLEYTNVHNVNSNPEDTPK